jgi:hypothetical protein
MYEKYCWERFIKTYEKYCWERFIKSPIKNDNSYITCFDGTYKIVEIKLHRHFSYVNISRVKSDGTLTNPIYLSIVGSSWKDTNHRLAVKIGDYVNKSQNIWLDLGSISC